MSFTPKEAPALDVCTLYHHSPPVAFAPPIQKAIVVLTEYLTVDQIVVQGSGHGESSFFMGRRPWHESVYSEGDKSKLLQNSKDRVKGLKLHYVCKPNHPVTHSR